MDRHKLAGHTAGQEMVGIAVAFAHLPSQLITRDGRLKNSNCLASSPRKLALSRKECNALVFPLA